MKSFTSIKYSSECKIPSKCPKQIHTEIILSETDCYKIWGVLQGNDIRII